MHRRGKKATSYTSVSAAPLFGELLACQFADWLDLPARQAPADPRSRRARRTPCRRHSPLAPGQPPGPFRLAGILDSGTVRHSPAKPGKNLREFRPGRARKMVLNPGQPCRKSGVHGIIFSNELLDAIPVHRLGWDAAAKKMVRMGRRTPRWRLHLDQNAQISRIENPRHTFEAASRAASPPARRLHHGSLPRGGATGGGVPPGL